MYICASQSLFSHSYVVNEWLNRHCNVQIDIGIRADELGISHSYVVNEWLNRHCNVQIDIGIRADELGIDVVRRCLFQKKIEIFRNFIFSKFFEKSGLKNFEKFENNYHYLFFNCNYWNNTCKKEQF
jgi:hypothetical protein